MTHIAPRQKQPGLFFAGENVQTGIDEFKTSWRLQRDLQRMTKKTAHHAAMSDDDDLLAVMLRRELVEIGDVTLDLLAHALAARDHVVRSHRAKLTPLFRILRDNFVAIESLKNSE